MPKPPINTLFYVVRTVGGGLEGLLAVGEEKMRYMFSTIAPPRGLQSKYCYIRFDTPTPSVADVEAQGAYFKGADSTRGPSFSTFYYLVILYFEIPCSDFTW